MFACGITRARCTHEFSPVVPQENIPICAWTNKCDFSSSLLAWFVLWDHFHHDSLTMTSSCVNLLLQWRRPFSTEWLTGQLWVTVKLTSRCGWCTGVLWWNFRHWVLLAIILSMSLLCSCPPARGEFPTFFLYIFFHTQGFWHPLWHSFFVLFLGVGRKFLGGGRFLLWVGSFS